MTVSRTIHQNVDRTDALGDFIDRGIDGIEIRHIEEHAVGVMRMQSLKLNFRGIVPYRTNHNVAGGQGCFRQSTAKTGTCAGNQKNPLGGFAHDRNLALGNLRTTGFTSSAAQHNSGRLNSWIEVELESDTARFVHHRVTLGSFAQVLRCELNHYTWPRGNLGEDGVERLLTTNPQREVM